MLAIISFFNPSIYLFLLTTLVSTIFRGGRGVKVSINKGSEGLEKFKVIDTWLLFKRCQHQFNGRTTLIPFKWIEDRITNTKKPYNVTHITSSQKKFHVKNHQWHFCKLFDFFNICPFQHKRNLTSDPQYTYVM